MVRVRTTFDDRGDHKAKLSVEEEWRMGKRERVAGGGAQGAGRLAVQTGEGETVLTVELNSPTFSGWKNWNGILKVGDLNLWACMESIPGVIPC